MADYSKLSSYFFIVEVDGIQTARFQKCEGLEGETEVIEYEEGGGEIHRFKGRTRFPNIILEKGINDNDELFKWHKQVVDGTIERKSGAIVLCNLAGEEIKRWNFFKAFPCRWVGPKLDTHDPNTFAVERIEIAHEGIEVDENEDAFQKNQENEGSVHTTKNENEFFIKDWSEYPEGIPKPKGPFRILEGEEYNNARDLANKTNANIHKTRPDLKGAQIHEIHPVKFGGSPTDIENKVALSPKEHAKYTTYWNKILFDKKRRH